MNRNSSISALLSRTAARACEKARSRRLLPYLVMICLAWAMAVPAGAWTATTERTIMARALGTMPRSLRLVLTGHRDQLYRDALAGAADRDLPSTAWIAAESEKAVRMIRERQPFALTARQLGRVGILTAATADPYLAATGRGTPPPAHHGFQQFTERMLHLIPFVIPEDERLARRRLLEGRIDPAGYLGKAVLRSASYTVDLEAHVPAAAAGAGAWAAFDARSTPFGVTSVSVSRASTRVSAIWLWIWQQAGGAATIDKEPS